MAEPISEQITQAIVTVLKTIQRPTYPFSVEVDRVSVFGNSTAATNKDVALEVLAHAPRADWGSGYANRIYKTMRVGIFANIRASSKDTTPADAMQARVIGVIQDIVEANRQWGGLACYSETVSPEFGYDGQQPGADIFIDVRFFTNSTDSTSLT